MLKTNSLFLIFLVLIFNQVAMCSDYNGHVVDVHLVHDEYDTHECNGNETHSCSTHHFDHELCNDVSVIPNRTQRFGDVTTIAIYVISFFNITNNNEPQIQEYRKNYSIHSVPQKRYLQVLRI